PPALQNLVSLDRPLPGGTQHQAGHHPYVSLERLHTGVRVDQFGPVWEGGLDSVKAVRLQRSDQISYEMYVLCLLTRLIADGCMLSEDDGLRLTQDNCISATR